MEQFNKIYLNIPHSSDKMADAIPYDDAGQLRKDVDTWTDWFTDKLFGPCNVLRDRVFPIIFEYSRFYVDVERLPDDPLEEIGEGIIYENFKGNARRVSELERAELMKIYRGHIGRFAGIGSGTMVIDCHSFPSFLSDDIDFCIGINYDATRPSDELVGFIAGYLSEHGWRVGINRPYANSFAPAPPESGYKSLMIEVNKRVYMENDGIAMRTNAYQVSGVINNIYARLLSE